MNKRPLPDLSFLYDCALKFRQAIEKAKFAGEFTNDRILFKFPTACCGDASCLLGQYLLDYGISSKYVCGMYYDNTGCQSHAWIEVGDIIVDITGDQFKLQSKFFYYDIPVFVGKPDEMHLLFEVEEINVRPTAPLDKLGPFAAPRLSRLYKSIKAFIE